MGDWEELYEDHKDNMARSDMEMEMFGEVLNDDALADELDALVDGAVAAEMGALAPQMNISDEQAQRYREENGLAHDAPIP